jgi:tetratricopeptide (TPR) repeat protein
MKRYQSYQEQDEERFNTISNIARVLRNENIAEAEKYAMEAFDLARDLNSNRIFAKAHQNLGYVYSVKRQYDSAIHQLETASQLFLKVGDKQNVYDCMGRISTLLYRIGRYGKSYSISMELMKEYEMNGNLKSVAIVNGDLANMFVSIEDYDKALIHYEKALEIFKSGKDSLYIAAVHSNLGNLHYHRSDYLKAIESYKNAIAIDSLIENRKNRLATDISNLGINYGFAGEYALSSKFISYGNKLATEMADSLRIGLNKSFEAKILLLLMQSSKGAMREPARLQSAVMLANDAVRILRRLKDLLALRSAYDNLAQVMEYAGDYRNALYAYREFVALSDSTGGVKSKVEVSRMEMSFEKEKELAILEAKHLMEIKKQKEVKRLILTGSILFALFSIAIFLIYRRQARLNTARQEAELKAQIADTQTKVLRLQMNPHFIFNSLNSISQYIRKNNAAEADHYLSKFAKVMRMTLENSEQPFISLAEELNALELYMQLEAKRLNDKFDYSIAIDPALDQESLQVPPLILQPFVENSIWHGFAKKEGKGHISIRIFQSNDMLNCVIEDNGVGLDGDKAAAQVEKKQSLGTKITRARIELLNRLHGAEASVQLMERPETGGVQAALQLPLQSID